MMRKITLLLITLSSCYINSQKIMVDSMAKIDFAPPLNYKVGISKIASKTASLEGEEDSQYLNANRDLFQINKLKMSDVNTVVGKPDIRIPIYNINFQGINIPVELVYNSGGIKVNQFASEVGLGWFLSTGGNIEKEIIKTSDSKSRWVYSEGYKQLFEICHGYLSANNTDHSSVIRGISETDLPDLYHVNFLNLNTSFYLNSDLKVQQIYPYESLMISTVYDRYDENFVKKYGYIKDYSSYSPGYLCSSNPSINSVPVYLLGYYDGYQCSDVFKAYKEVQSIKIIKDHFTYNFNDFSVLMPVSTINSGYIVDSGANFTPTYFSDVNRYNNQYYISEIVDNLSKKKVSFSYLTHPGMNSYISQSVTFDVFRKGYNEDYYADHAIVDQLNIDYDSYVRKYISQIKTDNEIIDFEYLNGREDSKSLDIEIGSPTNWTLYKKDPYLSKVYVKDVKGNIKYMYSFNYSYFDSQCKEYNTQYNEEQCHRLKLNSVVKYSDVLMQNIVDKFVFDYYEDSRLPKIGSYQIDPFGYKSPLEETEVSSLISDKEMNPGNDIPNLYAKHYVNKRVPKRPNLYMYNDLEDGIVLSYYSTLKMPALSPLKVNTASGYDQLLATLQDTRAWSLKSIEYLTQGKQNFNYELNSFKWKGQIINGAGIRIANIDISDRSSTYATDFLYSEGQINNLPIVTNGKYFFYYGNSNNPTISISQNLFGKETLYQGGNVIYQKVTKKLPNKGKIVEKFSSINDYPLKVTAKNSLTNTEFNLFNYYFPANVETFFYMNKNFLIGNIVERSHYDSLDNLISKSEYVYSENKLDFPTINNLFTHKEATFEQDHDSPYSFAFNYVDPQLKYISASLGNYSFLENKYTVGNEVKLYRYNLFQNKTIDYFNQKWITKYRAYDYLEFYNLPKSITDTSNNNVYKYENLYPFEQGNQFNSRIAIDDNIKTMSVGTNNIKNGKNLFQNINKFEYYESGNINLVEKAEVYPQNSTNKIYFLLYDNKSNVLEYKSNEGIPKTVIWGYNQTQPIAKIEGATYAQIMQAFSLSTTDASSYLGLDIVKKSDLDIDDTSEQDLLSALDTFRNNTAFKDFKITTYTYDPLIGVTSVTSPNGMKEFYKYNAQNKLEKVLDADHNILKEYKYQYKQ